MNSQAIATHLNILDSAIIEIQEWASVLWVKFVGGVRFVSKKIGTAKMSLNNEFTQSLNGYGHRVWQHESGAQVEEMAEGEFCPTRYNGQTQCLIAGVGHKRIDDLGQAMMIAVEAQVVLNKEVQLAADQEKATAEKRAARQSQAFAATQGMMQTSTGQWVTADEWDDIEGAM
jgi:hypothetical protein